jgi:amino acid transporter
VETALGPFVGFMAGALLVLATLSAASAVSTVFGASVAALAGRPDSSWVQRAAIVISLAGLAAINVRGVRTGARAVEIATLGKLVPLVGFVAIGAAFVQPVHLVPAGVPAPPALLSTIGIVFFAFGGVENALAPSGEVRDPARTVPLALLIGLGGVTVLYLAIQTVAQGILGAELADHRATPLAEAAARVAGEAGRAGLIAGAAISILGMLTGVLLAAPRNLFALGRDGFLPKPLSAVHPRYRTPHVAIVVFATVATALALSGTFEQLALLTNGAAFTLYFLCAVAAWTLRRRDVRDARSRHEPFRSPGGPLVPLLTCAALLTVMYATISRREVAAIGLTLAIAAVLYLLRARRFSYGAPERASTRRQ